ncbi:hypothetical protein PCASD_19980 [Puccinia coronata f. sp. avenae]|uniref:Uncharacterized protein n=1 Tax=Puccinia coronata f. sp. avenae TaxID=200324 RepID=A0A2N5SQ55_9BASI|nr:hypothetical protein PCASD_19980 [Puccinia coronata f. sp. avenae]
MTKSTRKSTAARSHSTKSTQSIPKSIRQQIGLISQNFQILANKPDHDVSVDANPETWDKALNELQFSTLPLLRQQINTLPTLLNSSELQDDMNGSLLGNIIAIQSGLDQTFDRMLSIAADIQTDRDSLFRTDDKHLKNSKEFKRHEVSFDLERLDLKLLAIFESGARTNMMIKFKKSTKATPIRTTNHTDEIVQRTTAATEEIDRIMKWLTSHEFINIRDEWGATLTICDNKITRLTQLINQRINYLEPEDDGKSSDDLASSNKRLIPLAQLSIPIIKLSRLFFNKLARDGLNKIPIKPFTDMNSCQLQALRYSAGDIRDELSRVVESIEQSAKRDEYDPTGPIIQAINKMRHRFESNLLLVILYIIPLIPNSSSSPNDLKNSLITWNDLFLIATRNCICACRP